MEPLVDHVRVALQTRKAAIDEALRQSALRGLVRDEAEDVLQETWITALERSAQYTGRGPIDAWIAAICRHKTANFLRAKARRAAALHRFAALAIVFDEWPSGAEVSSELLHGSSYIDDELRHAISNLPPRERDVVRLRINHEMSFRQISRIFGIAEATARSTFRNAVGTLKRQISPPRSISALPNAGENETVRNSS